VAQLQQHLLVVIQDADERQEPGQQRRVQFQRGEVDPLLDQRLGPTHNTPLPHQPAFDGMRKQSCV
jgi:hypothetical protein